MAADGATEFRPYRRALGAILASITVGAILYLLASIGVAVFSQHKVRLRGKPINADNIEDVLACQKDVERLFGEINERTFGLQGMVGKQDTDLAQQWETFSTQWHDDWAEVGQRCRFMELRDHGLGPDFDRLAWAHNDLEDMKLKFAALLHNYIDDQVPHIEAIRRSLEMSRRGLETRRKQTSPQAGGAIQR